MPHGLISNGVYLRKPTALLREEALRLHKFLNPQYVSASVFSPYSRLSGNIPEYLEYAEYDSQSRILRMPRGADLENFSPEALAELANFDFKRRQHKSEVDFPLLQVTLNPEQKAMLRAFRKARKNVDRPFGNYLFQSSTSTGKTILLATAAARLRQRTLVLCGTNLIRDTWTRDIAKAFGLPERRLGLIQRDKWVIGEYFTLASVATIDRRKARWDELFKLFGTIVLDEAHTASEPRIYEFLDAATCRYLLGATATVDKENGQNVPLRMALGNPIHVISSQNVDTATSMALRSVRIIKTDFRYTYDPLDLDLNDLSLALSSDEARNQLIVAQAVADWRKGHSVIVATNRVPHIYVLHEMFLEAGVRDANTLHGAVNTKSGYASKLVKAFNERKTRLVIANITSIKLGANMNPLDRLHLVWPVNSNDLTQLVGRLRRKDPKKKDSEVVYYLDRHVEWAVRRYYQKVSPVFAEMGVKGFR